MAEFRFPQFIPDPNDPPSVGKKIAAAIPDVLAQPVIKGAQFWNGFMGGQTAIPNTPVYDATVLAPQGVTAPVAPGVTQKLGAAVGDVLSLPFSGLQALGNYIDPREVAPVKSITPRMDAIRAMPGYNAVADAPAARALPAAGALPAALAGMPMMDIPGSVAKADALMDVSKAPIVNAKTVANMPTLAAAAGADGDYTGPRRLRQDLSFRQLAMLPAVPKTTNAKEQAGAVLLTNALGILNDPKATGKDREKALAKLQGIYATGLPMADLIAEAATK